MLRKTVAVSLLALATICVPVWPQSISKGSEDPEKPTDQWIVAAAPVFHDAIEPLCEFRRSQGMKVVVLKTEALLDSKQTPAQEAVRLRGRIAKLCREWPGVSRVLLVGTPTSKGTGKPERTLMPALEGSVARMTKQPTDNGYGCLDETLLPTVAVGRFPANSEADAKAMVEKTLAWEQDKRPGSWKRRITVLAGAPAYNKMIDAMIEKMAFSRFNTLDPIWFGRAIYYNPNSRFCLPRTVVKTRAKAYLEEGQALTVYLGHSAAWGFWGWGLMRREDWASLDIATGGGVFATFGCYGCQFAGQGGEGYGLAAMRNRRGPVAVCGANGECWAAMAMLTAEGLLKTPLHVNPPPRLGDVWLGMKRHLAKGAINPITYVMLNSVDGDPETPQAVQRKEHLEMFLLFGDPALRFPAMPSDIQMDVNGRVTEGSELSVSGTLPSRLQHAEVIITLERSLQSEPTDLKALDANMTSKERDRRMIANHDRANRFVLSKMKVETRDGTFKATLMLPEALPWREISIRVYATNDVTEAMAVKRVPCERKRNKLKTVER